MCAENGDLDDESSRVKAQNDAGRIVSDDLKSAADNCEGPSKRAMAVPPCKNLPRTPPTTAFSALPVEQEDYENPCKTLVLKSHWTPGLAAEAEEL